MPASGRRPGVAETASVIARPLLATRTTRTMGLQRVVALQEAARANGDRLVDHAAFMSHRAAARSHRGVEHCEQDRFDRLSCGFSRTMCRLLCIS